MAATSGRKAKGPPECARDERGDGRFQGRNNEPTDGRRERCAVVGEDAAQDGAAPA